MPAEKTYVLVHGAFHGGWVWDTLALELRARGHRVFTPTLTGCGERADLLSPHITIDTFVKDVMQVFTENDLHDVILVGHSFGGLSISGCADRIPERIRQLVFLDSLILENGCSTFGELPPDILAERKEATRASSGLSIPAPPAAYFGITDEAQALWVQDRLTPQPFSTYLSPIVLNHAVGNGLPSVYMECTEPLIRSLGPTRDWVRQQKMTRIELKTGHNAMLTATQALCHLLCAY